MVGSCSKINNRIKVMLMIIMEQKRKNPVVRNTSAPLCRCGQDFLKTKINLFVPLVYLGERSSCHKIKQL